MRLLVFVDVMKELPTPLILQPFNFNTLAQLAYGYGTEELAQGCLSLVLDNYPSQLISSYFSKPPVV